MDEKLSFHRQLHSFVLLVSHSWALYYEHRQNNSTGWLFPSWFNSNNKEEEREREREWEGERLTTRCQNPLLSPNDRRGNTGGRRFFASRPGQSTWEPHRAAGTSANKGDRSAIAACKPKGFLCSNSSEYPKCTDTLCESRKQPIRLRCRWGVHRVGPTKRERRIITFHSRLMIGSSTSLSRTFKSPPMMMFLASLASSIRLKHFWSWFTRSSEWSAVLSKCVFKRTSFTAPIWACKLGHR